jgi:DnaK suppressor protein
VKADLKLVRQILESRLEKAACSRGLDDSIVIHHFADPVDMVQAAAERDIALEILDRESTLVPRLRSAIDRIQDGSYGVCLQCGEEIAPKRLIAIPWAELCIDCQERADDLASQKARVAHLGHGSEAA